MIFWLLYCILSCCQLSQETFVLFDPDKYIADGGGGNIPSQQELFLYVGLAVFAIIQHAIIQCAIIHLQIKVGGRIPKYLTISLSDPYFFNQSSNARLEIDGYHQNQ